MLGGMAIAEVEAVLSAAMTASLCVPARDRVPFVAQLLIAAAEGRDVASAAKLLNADPPTEKPPSLDDEISELNELVRDAVNCAARHADEPLRRMADHLLRQSRQTPLQLPGDDAADAAAAATAAAAVAARQPVPSPATAPPAAAKATESANPLQKALEARRAPHAGRDVPVIGKTESAVFPSVVGALQHEAAKRAARVVDESVIAQAMKAGSHTGGMQVEEAPAKKGRR